MVNSKKLAQVLIKISQSKNSDKALESYFTYLKEKNFLSLLPQIKKYIERYREKTLANKTLVIRSKFDLSSDDIKQIISLVGANKDTNIDFINDNAVLGGFSVTYNGYIYDGSLENQIFQLEKKLRS